MKRIFVGLVLGPLALFGCSSHPSADTDPASTSAAIDITVTAQPAALTWRSTVAVGGNRTCAINVASPEKLRCWGEGFHGGLGLANENNIGDNETPKTAGDVSVGSGWEVKSVAMGGYHTCAILSGVNSANVPLTGAVRCWGDNQWGQLGLGNKTTVGDNEVPSSVGTVNVGGTVVQLAAGQAHTCALLSTGTVRCWGNNSKGQLGYGNTNNVGDDETPATVGDVDLGDKATAIAAGGYHTCARLRGGHVRCWGAGANGQLGYGNESNIGDDPGETPASVGNIDIGSVYGVIDVTAGYSHTCVVIDGGGSSVPRVVRCWGYGAYGQLGYGNSRDVGASSRDLPSTAGDVNVGSSVQTVVAGAFHTCALLTTGAVRCWGNAASGQLGYGSSLNIGDGAGETAGSGGDVNVGGSATSLAAGSNHTCAVLSTGTVRCWGQGYYGQLGYSSTTNVGAGYWSLPYAAGNVSIW